MGTIAVSLSGVTKSYGSVEVLTPIDLNIEAGAFTSLLGPSGCGKTTILNLIAGLDKPSGGVLSIGKRTVFDSKAGIDMPTERRNIGYVFQTYALWPHMTVLLNVAYPLKLRKIPRAEREMQARAILDRLELGTLADRFPFQLSGGQQQRVAIARALVYRAELLLLDEPLSNLDAQLRERARSWLADVHREFGLTTILVTHDQSEAMSLSDRVILLSKGRIEQEGAPDGIYEAPDTAYAAEFVGNSNLIEGTVMTSRAHGAGFITEVDLGIARVAAQSNGIMTIGTRAAIAVRPHKVAIVPQGAAVPKEALVLPFSQRNTLYQGATIEVLGDTELGRLRALTEYRPQGDKLNAVILPADCRCVVITKTN
ncbi:MAG: transporter related protein [Devosia sp.]|uniref:ABC transporter ATP-binding protein n=1 Tax=Devosia sp. TaxID=1871048 RepID=UPI00261381D5|nr:ABC transporter ATP-binding protein [Devosia sp.]MDB5527357.1 transporter related protein [Devosia sp.]